MLERTLIYVDTSYLLASFYNSWETGARSQLEIDLPAVVNHLGELVEAHLGQPVHRQYWYDGIPDSGPHRYQRALRTCDGVHLRSGQLIEWGERRTQKAVDTRLVADMIVAAMRGQVSDMVLVSGDADMIPGVEEACANGVRVHLYGFGWDSMSSALRHACDSTTILDPREDFGNAMQIEVLEGPLPPVIRSKPLGDASEPEQGGITPIPDSSLPQAIVVEAMAESVVKDSDSSHTTHSEFLTQHEMREKSAHPAAKGAADGVPGKAEGNVVAGTETQNAGGAADAGGAAEAQPAAASETSGATPTAQTEEGAAESSSAPAQAEAQSAEAGTPEAQVQEQAEKPEGTATTAATPAATPAPNKARATKTAPKPTPKPSMMAPKRKLRSRYVPLPNEVWASAGFQTPFDVGQQYAAWWYENAATTEQRDNAHLLSGGGLPSEVDRPLLQFACETLHEYTLTESQRVNLRDGFHAGIRSVLVSVRRDK